MAYAEEMHDLTQLTAVGRRRKKLAAEIESLRPELDPLIRAAHLAGVKQVDIMKLTGLSREMVRLASMSEAEREAEREKRRAK